MSLSKLYLSVMMIRVPKHTKLFLLFLYQASEIIMPASPPRLYHPLVIRFNLQILIPKPQNFGFLNQSVSLPEKPHPLDPILLQIKMFFIRFICFSSVFGSSPHTIIQKLRSQVNFFIPRTNFPTFTRLFRTSP